MRQAQAARKLRVKQLALEPHLKFEQGSSPNDEPPPPLKEDPAALKEEPEDGTLLKDPLLKSLKELPPLPKELPPPPKEPLAPDTIVCRLPPNELLNELLLWPPPPPPVRIL